MSTKAKSKKPRGKKELLVDTNPNILKGAYSNQINVQVSDSEVTLDFSYVYNPGGSQAIHQSRVIVSPKFAVKIAEILNSTVEKHDKKKPSGK